MCEGASGRADMPKLVWPIHAFKSAVARLMQDHCSFLASNMQQNAGAAVQTLTSTMRNARIDTAVGASHVSITA